MTRRIRRTTIALLISILLSVALVEGGLRLFDPWRMGELADHLHPLQDAYRADPLRGYVERPGAYQTGAFVTTILPDTTRRVPDTNLSAPCTLTLLGDSVTFGMSVGDEETWANLIARELPAVHVINTGVIGYALDNVLATWHAFPQASAYLYLMIGNDIELPPIVSGTPGPRQSYLNAYLTALYAPPMPRLTMAQFEAKIDLLRADWRMTIAAFDEPFSHAVKAHYPALLLIPPYMHRTSIADGHANAEGNREIAAALLPIARTIVDRACPVI